ERLRPPRPCEHLITHRQYLTNRLHVRSPAHLSLATLGSRRPRAPIQRNPAYPSLATFGSRRSRPPIQRNPAYPSLATLGSRRSPAPQQSGRAPSLSPTFRRPPPG